MTEPGKILFAVHDGAYVLKLKGDVRLNLCATLDSFIENMFETQGFLTVLVDLTQADGIDSTTLGLLAKVSIEAQQKHNFKPAIFSTNPDINRLLQSMGFFEVFDIRPQAMVEVSDLGELPVRSCSEDEIREKVVEAHKILSRLNDENRLRFKDLLHALGADSEG